MRHLLLLLPLSLHAQSLADVCTAVRHIELGYWAEYRMTGDDGESSTIRNQMVATEHQGDTTFWWHETIARSDEGDMVIKSLVPGYPFDPSEVRDLIMQMGAEDPVRMPEAMLHAMQQNDATAGPLGTSLEACTASPVVGWETVETPAGSIRAIHIRASDDEEVDLWLAPAVPFGLVQVRAHGFTLLLLGHGTDAQPAITRPVQDM